MPQQCQFRFTVTLSAFPACGKDWPGSAMGAPPTGGSAPGIDDLPLEETEALVRHLMPWTEAVVEAAQHHDPGVFSAIFTGTGNTQAECQTDAIDRFINAMGPMLQILSEQDVLDRVVTFDYPQSIIWIEVMPGVHLFGGVLRDDQGTVTAWEVQYPSPSIGQVPIAVCVVLRVHVELV